MQYGTSDRLIAKTQRKRQSKGCYEIGVKAYRIENFKYTNCIGNHTVPVDFITEAFTMYEKGFLPFPGTLGEQPAKIIEIFELIYRRRAEHVKKNSDKGS